MLKVDEVAAVVVVFEEGKISLEVEDSIEGGKVEVVDGGSESLVFEGAGKVDKSTSLRVSR